MTSILSTSIAAAAPAGTGHVDPMFAAIPAGISKLAAKFGMEIVTFGQFYGLTHSNDVLLGDVTINDIDHYLTGYLNGKDDVDVPALIDELAKAETIIQILTANMSDGQRTKACNSLEAIGFPVRHATRCKQRQDVIAAARGQAAVQ